MKSNIMKIIFFGLLLGLSFSLLEFFSDYLLIHFFFQKIFLEVLEIPLKETLLITICEVLMHIVFGIILAFFAIKIFNHEKMFRLIYDNASIGMLLYDLDKSQFSLANNMICEMLQRPEKEIKGQGISILGNIDKFFTDTTDFQSNSKNYEKNILIKKSDNSVLYADISTTACFLNNRKHIILSVIDVSDRNLSEEKYKSIFEEANDAIYLIDNLERKILESNKKASEMLGYSSDEFKALSIPELHIPSEMDLIKKSVKILMAEGRVSNITGAHHLKKDGNLVPVEINAKRIFLGNQDLHVSIVRDVSEKRTAERKLKNSESRFRKIFERSYEAIILAEKGSLRIISCNNQTYKLLGYTKNEMFTKTLFDLHPKSETQNIFNKFVDQNLHEAFVQDIPMLHKSGTTFYVDAKSTLIELEEKEYLLVFFQDITQQKIEKEKREQLIKDLKRANDELEVFANVVSHDLKAPLRSINMLSCDLLANYKDLLDAEGKLSLEMISSGVKKMHRLIESILEYSRISYSKDEFQHSDINQIIQDLKAEFSPYTNIEIKVMNQLPHIDCSPTKIFQVYQNLISNAVKYIDKEKGVIEISCKKGETHWQFGVKDNGPGIKEKYFDKIFHIFETLQTDKDSSGIGLSIVKKIVEHHNGEVWLTSIMGLGTTFYFSLPINDQKSDSSPSLIT